jgi:hypothetical protein
MRPARSILTILALGIVLASHATVSAQSGTAPTIAQFLGAASPIEVVAARSADRVAWIAYEQGSTTSTPPRRRRSRRYA